MKRQSNTYNPFAGHKFEPSLWPNPDSYKQDDNKMKRQSITNNPFFGDRFEPSQWQNPDSYKQDDNKMKGQFNSYNPFEEDKQNDNKMKKQFKAVNPFAEGRYCNTYESYKEPKLWINPSSDKQDDNKITFTLTYYDENGLIDTFECRSEEELMNYYNWYCEHRNVSKSKFSYTNNVLTHITIIMDPWARKQNWNRIGTPFLWARKGLVAVIDTKYDV